MKNRLKIEKMTFSKKFEKFFPFFSLGTPSGTVPNAVPTLNHLFLVSVINSHLFSPNHVEKSRHCQEIRHILSKTTHSGFIC